MMGKAKRVTVTKDETTIVVGDETKEAVAERVRLIKKQIEKFVSFDGENGAIIVNNADWLLDLKFVDFVREIGSLFSVNRMLSAECYKQRMETGLTFLK